jgi:undecaprenyl-diphosphatase
VGYEASGFRFWLMIVIACIPGGFFGILLDDLAETYLFSPYTVAASLFVGAILMIYAEDRFRGQNGGIEELKITPKQAILIGFFQCLAIIPGMSRSASTIIGGWIAGLSTVAAAEFSFFLAIPVMVGMSFLKIVKMGGFGMMTGSEWIALIIGFVVSFVVALFVIRRFIHYLQHKPMKIFAKYRMGFAVFVVAAGLLGFF